MKIYSFRITEYPSEATFWKPEEDCPEWEIGRAVGEKTESGQTFLQFVRDFEPEGWADYAREMWPEWDPDGGAPYKPFFWPSQTKIWKSRSSAADRVRIVEQWGGKAEVLESEVDWVTSEYAAKSRKLARMRERIDRKLAEAGDLIEQSKRLAKELEEGQ